MTIRYDERLSPGHYSEGPTMESWRKVWRDGLAPQLSTKGLLALKRGLLEDDPRLLQGETTKPPPMQCVLDWPCEGGCLATYAAWQGDGINTVGELEELFSKMCYEADQRIGEPAVVRYLLNWFDDTPRHEMRRLLLVEVNRELSERAVRAAPPPADREATVDLGSLAAPGLEDTVEQPVHVLIAVDMVPEGV